MFPLQEWLNKVTLGRAVPFKGSFPFQAPYVKNSMCKILVSAAEFSVNRRLEVFQLIWSKESEFNIIAANLVISTPKMIK